MRRLFFDTGPEEEILAVSGLGQGECLSGPLSHDFLQLDGLEPGLRRGVAPEPLFDRSFLERGLGIVRQEKFSKLVRAAGVESVEIRP